MGRPPANQQPGANFIGRYEPKSKSGVVYRAYVAVLDREMASQEAKADKDRFAAASEFFRAIEEAMDEIVPGLAFDEYFETLWRPVVASATGFSHGCRVGNA